MRFLWFLRAFSVACAPKSMVGKLLFSYLRTLAIQQSPLSKAVSLHHITTCFHLDQVWSVAFLPPPLALDPQPFRCLRVPLLDFPPFLQTVHLVGVVQRRVHHLHNHVHDTLPTDLPLASKFQSRGRFSLGLAAQSSTHASSSRRRNASCARALRLIQILFPSDSSCSGSRSCGPGSMGLVADPTSDDANQQVPVLYFMSKAEAMPAPSAHTELLIQHGMFRASPFRPGPRVGANPSSCWNGNLVRGQPRNDVVHPSSDHVV